MIQLNQVCAIDITFIPMKRGFMYLFAIIDLYSRYVVGWDISNSMTSEWCVGVLKDAVERYGKRKLLIVTNTERPHQSLSYLPPLKLYNPEIKKAL